MSGKQYSNIIGFDDAPFSRNARGRVRVVGAVFANMRLDGVLIGDVQKDGDDSANQLADLVSYSKFAQHIQLIMLQGISVGGFNVVDVFKLHQQLKLPVIVVSRRLPDMLAIKKALLEKVQGGHEKWAIIEKLGLMQPAGAIHFQQVGLDSQAAKETIKRFSVNSHIPEPVRCAHLIAGALTNGQSRGDP